MGNAIINHKSLLQIKRALSFHFRPKVWNKSTTIRESTFESISVSVLALLFWSNPQICTCKVSQKLYIIYQHQH